MNLFWFKSTYILFRYKLYSETYYLIRVSCVCFLTLPSPVSPSTGSFLKWRTTADLAYYGITGSIELVEVSGPEIILRLEGRFLHKRTHILGLSAMWLNARMPDIAVVIVENMDELNDFEEIRDKFTGDIIETIDRRFPDFNGDRTDMEYQGLDSDTRGPFPG